MKYKSVCVIRNGSPDVLEVIENELRPPLAKEVRIKILATAVTASDYIVRGFKLPRWHLLRLLKRES